MSTNERKTIDKLFELCDKYIEQGDLKKARECLRKIQETNSETFEQAKSGLSSEDIEKE